MCSVVVHIKIAFWLDFLIPVVKRYCINRMKFATEFSIFSVFNIIGRCHNKDRENLKEPNYSNSNLCHVLNSDNQHIQLKGKSFKWVNRGAPSLLTSTGHSFLSPAAKAVCKSGSYIKGTLFMFLNQ